MVRAYKNNINFDFWSVFLGRSDPSEVEEKWYLFQKYSEYEMGKISKYIDKKRNLQNKLKEVEQRIRLEAVLKEKLVLEEKNVKKLEETRKSLLNQLANEKKKFIYPTAVQTFLMLEDEDAAKQFKEYSDELASNNAAVQAEAAEKLALEKRALQEQAKALKKAVKKPVKKAKTS